MARFSERQCSEGSIRSQRPRFAAFVSGRKIRVENMASALPMPSIPIIRERVTSLQFQQHSVVCVLPNQAKLLLSRLLEKHIAVGDEITFPVPTERSIRAEVLIDKRNASEPNRYVYQAAIGYVSQPKQVKREQYFVSAEIPQGRLGVSTIFLPCEILREYFYRLSPASSAGRQPTLYDILRVPVNASPSELRVAFKLRQLELKVASCAPGAQIALERAFNIIGQPEMRACYDGLLADPEAPAVFPYGGFGSLLVVGETSRDGQSFFARRILAFSPDLRRRRFHVPLRRCDFYDDRALCRDPRRKLEFWLDPAALHTL